VKLVEKTTKDENSIYFTEDTKLRTYRTSYNTQNYYLFPIFSFIMWSYIRREISLSLFPFKLFAAYDGIITNTN